MTQIIIDDLVVDRERFGLNDLLDRVQRDLTKRITAVNEKTAILRV